MMASSSSPDAREGAARRYGIRWCWMPLAILVLGLFAAPARAAWTPPQKLTWYWQLQGTINNSYPAAAYDIDGFANSSYSINGQSNTSNEVPTLHTLGKKVICYIDVGTWENWRPDAGQFPSALLGKSNGWPGERWLNISPSSGSYSQLQSIMVTRFQICQQNGFDAVEPDNMDGYTNRTGFNLTAGDQLAYDEWVASEVHSLGMAVFQKNLPEQATALQPYFDGAIDEQCNQYSECSSFRPYLAAVPAKPVLNAEYKNSLYPKFCSADNAAGIMGALFDTALDGKTYSTCW
jgi:hypothetical protein